LGTFHATCARILRREAPNLGISRDYVIFDSSDQLNVAKQAIRELNLDDVGGQADRVLQPDKMIWVIVGDRAKIEENVDALGLGEIRLLDADGNPVEG
jgi:superfamily I DNA/RNA helicase